MARVSATTNPDVRPDCRPTKQTKKKLSAVCSLSAPAEFSRSRFAGARLTPLFVGTWESGSSRERLAAVVINQVSGCQAAETAEPQGGASVRERSSSSSSSGGTTDQPTGRLLRVSTDPATVCVCSGVHSALFLLLNVIRRWLNNALLCSWICILKKKKDSAVSFREPRTSECFSPHFTGNSCRRHSIKGFAVIGSAPVWNLNEGRINGWMEVVAS